VRTRAGVIAAVVVALTTVALGQETRSAAPRYERQIATTGPGPHRLVIHPQLLGGGAPFRVVQRGESFFAEDGLSDLRLFTTDGRPVPYLLVQPPSGERAWISGRVLPVAATKKTSGYEVDLTAAQDVDMLRMEGLPAPYLKRFKLEGSGDRARWTLLLDEATSFDLPDEKLRQNALAFPAGEYRYLRVTWDDANSGRLPLPSSVSARRASAVPPPPATTMGMAVERRPSEPGRSRYRIRLPAAGLPIVALDLDVAGGYVHRSVVVSESRFSGLEAAPLELGRAMLAQVTRDGVTALSLRVPIAVPAEPDIDLTIEDGENEPLAIRSVSIELAQLPWIYFEAPPGGSVVARYGDRALGRPSYDLEAVRGSIDIRAVREATWVGESATTPPAAPEAVVPATPQPGPELDPGSFRHSRAITEAAGTLAAVPLDAHALANSRGPAQRFADVRILDAQNRQIPYLLERRDEPLSIPLTIAPETALLAPELKQSGGRQRSVYTVTLPYANLPPGRIVFETTARVFQRTVRLGVERAPDRNRRDAWFDVRAADTWRHADERTPPRPLTLPWTGTADTELRLVIDEGDNAPLTISAVRLLLPSYRLRFYAPAASQSLRLVYGRVDLEAPQYDLALLAPRVMGAAAAEAGTAAPSAAAPSTSAALLSPRAFWVVLAGAVVVLLALIARLVRLKPDTTNDATSDRT
jgi:uncharacterized protein DUF3999